MKSGNVIQEKSYAFALKIVKVCKVLIEEKKEYILSKQLIRSGTAIGALVEEAIGGQSERDFFSKITISYKEGRESGYWIKLLRDSEYLSDTEASALLNDLDELLKIIGSIQISMRKKMNA